MRARTRVPLSLTHTHTLTGGTSWSVHVDPTPAALTDAELADDEVPRGATGTYMVYSAPCLN
jgi:hypothetical protein